MNLFTVDFCSAAAGPPAGRRDGPGPRGRRRDRHRRNPAGARLGARVIAVVSSDAKADAAREAGADEVVTSDDLHGRRRSDRRSGGRHRGGPGRRVAVHRFVTFVGAGGSAAGHRIHRRRDPDSEGEPAAAEQRECRGRGLGAFWMGRPGYLAEQWRDLEPLVADGRITLPVGQVFPLADAAAAVASLDERRATGGRFCYACERDPRRTGRRGPSVCRVQVTS